jgi:hypothetical protein
VYAIDFAEDLPPGNKLMFERGACPLRSQGELFSALYAIRNGPEATQLPLEEQRSRTS